jgi:hypothetical protein
MTRYGVVPISEELDAAIGEADVQGNRAFKIIRDPRRPRGIIGQIVPSSESLVDDIQAITPFLEDKIPCSIFVRLRDKAETIPSVTEADWGLVCWVPEDAPTLEKMKYNGLNTGLKEHFIDLNVKQMHLSSKPKDLHKALFQRLFPRSPSQLDLVTREENDFKSNLDNLAIGVEDYKGMIEFNMGLHGLTLTPEESFNRALGVLLTEEKGAMIAYLKGDYQEVMGEVLSHVTEHKDLSGRLLEAEACYVLMSSRGEEGRKKLVLLTWLPENGDLRLNVVFSANKVSMLELLRAAVQNGDLYQVELHNPEDLLGEIEPVHVDQVELARRASSSVGHSSWELRRPTLKKKRNPKLRRTLVKKNTALLEAQAVVDAATGNIAEAEAKAKAEDMVAVK